MTPSVYQLAPRRLTYRIHDLGGGYLGVIRDHHHSRWWKTVRIYPSKADAKKAIADALWHLLRDQYDPTIEKFNGEVIP